MSTLSKDFDHEMAAHLYLHHWFPEVRVFQKFGGWGASACFIVDVVQDILTSRPKFVVECGSGLSTVYIAAALKQNGVGKLYSLEHELFFRQKTANMLASNKLEDFAQPLYAPLTEQTILGQNCVWYTIPERARLRGVASMVVVDGPPQAVSRLSRFGAISLFAESPGEVGVFVDDWNTPETASVLAEWRKHLGVIPMWHTTPGVLSHIKMRVPALDERSAPGSVPSPAEPGGGETAGGAR